ncbi:MAG: hypothetical protein ACR2JB_10420 [Bryobacteraceae bacterium]
MTQRLQRQWVIASLAFATGLAVLSHWPFPDGNPLLDLVLWHEPLLWQAIKDAYIVMCFTTPYIAFSVLASSVYIFLERLEPAGTVPTLPPYPEPATRDRLFLILGEVHHTKRPHPCAHPTWLAIPERGLYTGIAIFGAIGTGKTSGCMYPFAEQLLAYQAHDPVRRIGGLVLEVKGDFCHQVHSILETHGRAGDYVEISLESDYRYNPLHNDLDAYALAYGIASLLNNLYGNGKEPCLITSRSSMSIRVRSTPLT